MKQNSFLKRTLIPVLLAVLMVTAIQLIPRQLPEAILPETAAGYDCHVLLIQGGLSSQTVDLNQEESANPFRLLQTVRVQNRGQSGAITGHPLLYQLIFTSPGEGEAYDLLLDPEGRLFSVGKVYKLQGENPRELFETVQQYLAARGIAPTVQEVSS